MTDAASGLGEVVEAIRRLETKLEKVLTEPKKTFTFEEASELLSISTQTLSRLVACGAVSPVTIGKRKFISARELDRIAQEGAAMREQQHGRRSSPGPRLSEAEKVLAELKKR